MRKQAKEGRLLEEGIEDHSTGVFLSLSLLLLRGHLMRHGRLLVHYIQNNKGATKLSMSQSWQSIGGEGRNDTILKHAYGCP
jgi:hypothetical protein